MKVRRKIKTTERKTGKRNRHGVTAEEFSNNKQKRGGGGRRTQDVESKERVELGR